MKIGINKQSINWHKFIKIILILLVHILIFIIVYSITSYHEKINPKYHNTYLQRNQEYFYDLSTFKYNPISNNYTIDVALNMYTYEGENTIKSPFDENNISYLIYSTKFSKKTKHIKIKYVGFISGVWDIGANHKMFKNAKIYHKIYKFKDLEYYKQDLEYCLSRISPNGMTYYEQDLNEINNASRNGLLKKMNGTFNSINRYVDD